MRRGVWAHDLGKSEVPAGVPALGGVGADVQRADRLGVRGSRPADGGRAKDCAPFS